MYTPTYVFNKTKSKVIDFLIITVGSLRIKTYNSLLLYIHWKPSNCFKFLKNILKYKSLNLKKD